MRIGTGRTLALTLVGALLVCGIPACGGGGGGSSPGTGAVTLQALLSGGNEIDVVNPNAYGNAALRVSDDGEMLLAVTVERTWVGQISEMTLCRGRSGEEGEIVRYFLWKGDMVFDQNTGFAEGAVELDPDLAAEIIADPGAYYLNIETRGAPDGLVRGQLARFTTVEAYALLEGSEEAVVVDPDARCAATILIGPTGRLDYVLAMRDPNVTEVGSAGIHVGEEGESTAVYVDLHTNLAALDFSAGTLQGTTSVGLSLMSRMRMDPSLFYVSVTTPAAPKGIARGQFTRETVEYWAPLSGDQERIVVDPDAKGGVTLELTSLTRGLVVLAVPPQQGITSVMHAHIHPGGIGVDGPPVVDLLAGGDLTWNVPTGSAEGSIFYDRAMFARILVDPASFYVNFHTAAAQAGLVRGQLTQAPMTFFSSMSGAEAVPVLDPTAGGAITLVGTEVHECTFTTVMASPAADQITQLQIRDGAGGVNGPVAIDLLGGTGIEVSGNTITGASEISGRIFARLLAAPEAFYGEAYAGSATAGICRGQMIRIADDTPPAGLTYDSPVVYKTGYTIPSNAPSSVGGSVQDYSILPALPKGLQIDHSTGIISGTPEVVSPTKDYTVTASNVIGSTTAIVTITVEVGLPKDLAYTTPISYVQGTLIPPNMPTSAGGAIDSYAVNPALPTGLDLDAVTGVISGTPLVVWPATDHLVTGYNAAGSTSTVVRITVAPGLLPPESLTYTSPVFYVTGTTIVPNSPSYKGGQADSFTVSPQLPSGLTIDSTTGVITGMPSETSPATDYTVTASNAAGKTTGKVNITVDLGAPKNLSYTNNPNTGYYYGGKPAGSFPTMVASVEGGKVETWSVSPSLPSGITLDSKTGSISGTPNAQAKQATYVVTAENATGSTTANVVITIQ